MVNNNNQQIEVRKPKTHRGKKYLESKQPHLQESEKKTLFIKGKKTNETVIGFMHDLYSFKKQNSVMFSRRNDLKPLEDQNNLQFLCDKNNCALFMFGSNTKKRPNNIVIGRLFDGQILDQVEFGIENFMGSNQFQNLNKILLNSRPSVIFQGDIFDYDPIYMRIKNLLLDFFVENVKLEKIDAKYGINYVISFSIDSTQKIYMRTYYVNLKNNPETNNNQENLVGSYELQEIGPRADLVVRRHQIASDEAYKNACKQQTKKSAKFKKNIKRDSLGNKVGRIYVDQQDLTTLNLKKRKAIKKLNNDKQNTKKVKTTQEPNENEE